MKYLKIPTLSNWEPDVYQALKRTDPEINQLLSDFEKYEQAPSPMAKRNMLPALLKDLDAWKPPWGHEPVAWGALRDIVKGSITYKEGGIARKYDQVVCIGYKFNVGKFDRNDRGFSFNKSLATGETSATLDLSLAGTGISVESTTPQGGTFGGGPPNSAVVVSFLGVQYNFSTGECGWNPVVSASKGPKAGIQAIVGFQVGINPTKLKQLGREMQACSSRQGS